MKKHIFGMAIFSFIVFASAFGYGIFSYSEVAEVDVPQSVPVEKTHCNFRQESNQSDVVQVIYSVKTKTLTWQGNLLDKENLTYFHFWVMDRNGLDYLDSVPTENILNGDKIMNSNGRSIDLSKLSASANLYLTTDKSRHPMSGIEFFPKFDKDQAIPVTIDYGK